MNEDNQGPMIYAAIAEVMKKMSAVGKDGVNQQQRFKFQKLEDIYNALHHVLAEFGVFTVPTVLDFERTEKPTKSGGSMTYTVARIRFTFFAKDGSSFEAVTIGEGSDSGDKSANKSMSAAHKYALIQVFAIPTKDVEDADRDQEDDGGESEDDPVAKGGTVKPPLKRIDPLKRLENLIKARDLNKDLFGRWLRFKYPHVKISTLDHDLVNEIDTQIAHATDQTLTEEMAQKRS